MPSDAELEGMTPRDLLRLGVDLYNEGRFFESHEAWEAVWMHAPTALRHFYQGLIQIAAGYHKYEIGNALGARKLLDRGVRTLVPLLPDQAWATAFAARVCADRDLLLQGVAGLPAPPRLPAVFE